MTSHLSFSNHVITVANFEKLLISPSFISNFRKSRVSYQQINWKVLRVFDKNLRGHSPLPWPEEGLLQQEPTGNCLSVSQDLRAILIVNKIDFLRNFKVLLRGTGTPTPDSYCFNSYLFPPGE